MIAERLALVAEWARYRHSQANGADAEVLDLVASGLEAQVRARRERGQIHTKRERRVSMQWYAQSARAPARMRTDEDERELAAGQATIIAKGR